MTKTPDEFDYHDLDDKIPEGIGTLIKPEMYRIFVMPVRPQKKTAGGIYIPDQAVEASTYLNQMGRVAAIGEAAFRGNHLKSLNLSIESRLKVGDIVLFSARNPQRFIYKGARIMVINDDWIAGTIDPSEAADVKFYV